MLTVMIRAADLRAEACDGVGAGAMKRLLFRGARVPNMRQLM